VKKLFRLSQAVKGHSRLPELEMLLADAGTEWLNRNSSDGSEFHAYSFVGQNDWDCQRV